MNKRGVGSALAGGGIAVVVLAVKEEWPAHDCCRGASHAIMTGRDA